MECIDDLAEQPLPFDSHVDFWEYFYDRGEIDESVKWHVDKANRNHLVDTFLQFVTDEELEKRRDEAEKQRIARQLEAMEAFLAQKALESENEPKKETLASELQLDALREVFESKTDEEGVPESESAWLRSQNSSYATDRYIPDTSNFYKELVDKEKRRKSFLKKSQQVPVFKPKLKPITEKIIETKVIASVESMEEHNRAEHSQQPNNNAQRKEKIEQTQFHIPQNKPTEKHLEPLPEPLFVKEGDIQIDATPLPFKKTKLLNTRNTKQQSISLGQSLPNSVAQKKPVALPPIQHKEIEKKIEQKPIQRNNKAQALAEMGAKLLTEFKNEGLKQKLIERKRYRQNTSESAPNSNFVEKKLLPKSEIDQILASNGVLDEISAINTAEEPLLVALIKEEIPILEIPILEIPILVKEDHLKEEPIVEEKPIVEIKKEVKVQEITLKEPKVDPIAEIIPPIEPALKLPSSEDYPTQIFHEPPEEIIYLGAKNQFAWNLIRKLSARPRSHPAVETDALLQIAQQFGIQVNGPVTVSTIIDLLVETMRKSSAAEKSQAIDALLSIYCTFKDDIQNPLQSLIYPQLECLWDATPEVALEILNNLLTYKFIDQEILFSVICRLADKDASVKESATKVLEMYGISNKRSLMMAMINLGLLSNSVHREAGSYNQLDAMLYDFTIKDIVQRTSKKSGVEEWLLAVGQPDPPYLYEFPDRFVDTLTMPPAADAKTRDRKEARKMSVVTIGDKLEIKGW